MPEFKFSCPACGQNMTCDTAYVGSETTCPACQQSIIVPHPASAVPSYGEPVVAIKVSTLKRTALISLCVLLVLAVAWFAFAHLYKVTILTGGQHFNSRQAYRPPIEITVVAKTDSTNLRLGYAAEQIIFNWEMNPSQLRVDGGPGQRPAQRRRW